MQYGISTSLPLSYQEAVPRVIEELKLEGFGVLTTIDVKETMKSRLGVDFTNYVILGACNPPLAHQALLADEHVGLLLPCNVIVYEKEGETIVSAFDPLVMVSALGKEELQPIATEARRRLERVLTRLASQAKPGDPPP